MIKVNHLVKRYERKQALNDLTFSVAKGEIVALTGLKGAGKTTALDIIAGCMDADGGSVEICGLDISAETSSARGRLGYLPSSAPEAHDTPRAYMKFLADARGLMPREAGEKIDKALSLLELNDVAEKPMNRLAPGQKRLAALAEAIFFEPEVVVIDEPEQDMNPFEIMTFRKAVKALGEKSAVLLASRNLTEMTRLADRVLVISEGRIVSEGKPCELHDMTIITGTTRVTVACDSAAAAEKAFAAIGKTEIVEEKGGEVTLDVKAEGDRRVELFNAAAAAKLPIVEMVPARKTMDRLLESLVSERLEGEGEDA